MIARHRFLRNLRSEKSGVPVQLITPRYNRHRMSEEPTTPPTIRRPRLLWTLLGAMVIVSLVPLVVSHYFLIRINRDSLETLERKYLTRSAVGIATDVQNLLLSNTQQLTKIAGSIRIMKKALPPGGDPFTYAAETNWIADYLTPDSDLLALRLLNTSGAGAEAKPAGSIRRCSRRCRSRSKRRNRASRTPARFRSSPPRTSRRS